MSISNSDEIIKTISKSVMDCVSKAVKKLHYDKTYVGTVKEKNGSEYVMQIKGGEYKIKSKFDFTVGSTLYIMAIQNDMNHLLPLVSYDDL